MSTPRTALLIASLALAPALVKSARPAPDQFQGDIVTLYAADDLLSSFDFRNGTAGGSLQGGEVRLAGAQLAFDVFVAGQLSVGFSRNERVEVLDLGNVVIPPRSQARDRGAELNASLFHTLFRVDNGFSYIGPTGDVDPYPEADRILDGVPPLGVRHIAPVVGHTYLLRVRANDSSADELFKFRIIGLLPGHSVTFRWAPV